MTDDLLERSARFIDDGRHEGTASTNPVTGELAELRDDAAMVQAFSHSVLLDSGDGLVLFDTSLEPFGQAVVNGCHRWRDAPVDTIVYTHGHVDHVGGSRAILADAEARGRRRPEVVGHENVSDRFDRYELTDGYNYTINRRQFGARSALVGDGARRFSLDWVRPHVRFRDQLTCQVGDLDIELHHDLGETDDHAWAWLPRQRYLVTGDFLCWVFPNVGNPQKAQRFPLEWARALREMSTYDAELLLPAHGLPIEGTDRIRRVLGEVATVLEDLVGQVLDLMNAGAELDAIVHQVEVAPEVLERPYLRAVYDEPEFVVHNVWRLYGGWYDGNPSRLKPPPASEAAREVAALAGGSAALARRGAELAEAGDFRLACQLVELAVQADPEDLESHRVRADVYEQRRKGERSLMARGIYGWAADQSRGVVDGG